MKKFIVSISIIFVFTFSSCSSNTLTTPTPQFNFQCKDNYELTSSDSRLDGEWEVFTCALLQPDFQVSKPTATNIDNNRDSYTVVRNTNLSKSWTIPYKNFTWANEPLQHLVACRWSQDGNYLFLSPDSSFTGIFYSPKGFIDGYVLYRLNLNTGELETILPFDEKGYAFSPSQYNQYLAYVAPTKQETIHILNLDTWGNRQTEVDGNCENVGGFTWKSDGVNLVFTCGINDLTNKSTGTSFFLLNTNNMKIQSILENDKRLLFPLPSLSKERNFDYWLDTDLLSLWSPNDHAHYYLNLNTGVITPR